MKLRRLNMDTSWEFVWGKSRFLLDPWLVGSEVDYFKWFNEQWHTLDPVPPREIEKPDFILISQSYSDHTHEETLRAFDESIPILASPKAYKRLVKGFSSSRLVALPLLARDGLLEFGEYMIASIDPGNLLDPIYYAHIITKGNQAIFYSSHGFKLTDRQLDVITSFEITHLLTSFSEIKLPKLMGGKVNPGIENVNYLVETLKPEFVFNTHDEQKKHSGIVMKMAKTTYPDLNKVQLANSTFIHAQDYDFHEF